MIQYDDKYVVVNWNEDLKTIELQWKMFPSSEIFRSSMMKVLELFKSKNAENLITDSRKMRVVNMEDTEWVVKTITPQLQRSGLKHTAIILSESVLSKMSMRRVVKKTHTENPPSYFSNLEQARDWIQTL